MELFAVLVVPHLFGLVLSFKIDGAGIPVVFLPWNIATPLQEQNLFSGRRQLMGQRAAASAGADNDHIEMVLRGHVFTPLRQLDYIFVSPFAACLESSFEPSVAAPKLTPKRAHQMLTDLYLFRSASAGTS